MNNTTQEKRQIRLQRIVVMNNCSMEEAILIDKIDFHTSKNFSAKRAAYKINRKIELARQYTKQTVVCEETGIVALLEVPRLPSNMHLVYTNPLAIIENARGIAQQNHKYLHSLDTQILAGVLITLADDYSLFRYTPSFSGAQKNSILRSCNKTEIVHAIQTIEHFVNSNNVVYLPQLSFLMDADVQQNTFEQKLQQWVKLLVETIRVPDTEDYDEDAIDPSMARMSDILKANRDANRALASSQRAEKKTLRQLRADLKLALQITKALHKAGILSTKQKDILRRLCDANAFMIAPNATIQAIINKLSLMEAPENKEELTNLTKILSRNIKDWGMDDEFTPSTKSSEAAGSHIQANSTEANTVHTVANYSELMEEKEPEEQIEIDSNVDMLIEVNGGQFIVSKELYLSLSTIEKIKFKRNIVAVFKEEASEAKEEGEQE